MFKIKKEYYVESKVKTMLEELKINLKKLLHNKTTDSLMQKNNISLDELFKATTDTKNIKVGTLCKLLAIFNKDINVIFNDNQLVNLYRDKSLKNYYRNISGEWVRIICTSVNPFSSERIVVFESLKTKNIYYLSEKIFFSEIEKITYFNNKHKFLFSNFTRLKKELTKEEYEQIKKEWYEQI